MKTIRVLLMGLAWLALPVSGWAFYNPESGRWLSRDVIEEQGGNNVYRFVRNRSTTLVDPFGLNDLAWLGPEMVGLVPGSWNRCCLGTCGPDITDALKRTMQDIRSAFDGWTILQKFSACAAMLEKEQQNKMFDINELAYTSPDFQKGYAEMFPGKKYIDRLEKGSLECGCKDTVSIEGRCFYSSQATYVMLGVMVDLCTPSALNNRFSHTVMDQVVDKIRERKLRQFGQDAANPWTQQAVALAWYGDGFALPKRNSLPDCRVKAGDATHFDRFNWTWQPIKERTY